MQASLACVEEGAMAVVEGAPARDTSALVTVAQAGDGGALAELVSGALPMVYGVVGRALRGHADVDDVVQETMMRVICGLTGLRRPDRFRSWTAAIAHREVQVHLRNRRKVQRRLQEIL